MQLTVSSDWASTRHFRGSHCLAHCSGAPSEGLARCILHLSNPPCSRTRIGRQWAADTDRLPLARTQFHTLFLGSLFHGKQMDRRKERRSGRHTTARTREMERKRGEESKSSRKRDTKRKKAHAPAQEEGRAREREREHARARVPLYPCARERETFQTDARSVGLAVIRPISLRVPKSKRTVKRSFSRAWGIDRAQTGDGAVIALVASTAIARIWNPA
jgi:hypothetical protein